jgi:hypothetical protein
LCFEKVKEGFRVMLNHRARFVSGYQEKTKDYAMMKSQSMFVVVKCRHKKSRQQVAASNIFR